MTEIPFFNAFQCLFIFGIFLAIMNSSNLNHLIKEIIMSVNFKPLADRVLVEPAPAETKTASGLIIPDTAKEKPQEGVVVAIGNGKKDEPLTVKVGDKVLYGKYAGQELKLDGKDYLIIRESDLLGILG